MPQLLTARTPLLQCLGRPALRALDAAGFDSLESLAGFSLSQLLALHGVGPQAIRVLQEALENGGLPAPTQ